MNIRWTVCDGIGPFFRACPPGKINWSKIPFSDVEKKLADANSGFWSRLKHDFKLYCQNVRACGFNVITLDDVAHLCEHDFYPEDLKTKINDYHARYTTLFDIANDEGLQVWITTDLMFWNASIEESVGRLEQKQRDFFIRSIEKILLQFKQIKGIILRFGESDGKDVDGDFVSHLCIRTPAQMRRWLKGLLPIMEKYQCWCILRTWSVGVYQIGDMMWNPATLEKSLRGVPTQQLILSMKYGESDFFRYLPLNIGFWLGDVPKIIELQGRREYEGAGRFPSFMGYEYETYRNELSHCSSLVGMMVWIQTGGWTQCRRLTFLEQEGIWNELNVRITVSLFQSTLSCDELLGKLTWPEHFPQWCQGHWIEFCRNSHEVIRRLFYVENFAYQRLFFRRVRIPPMLGITWDAIWIHPVLNEILKTYLGDTATVLIQRSWEAVAMVDQMLEKLDGHPRQQDIELLRNTAEVLALSREVAFGMEPHKNVPRLQMLAREKKSEEHYDIHLSQDSAMPNPSTSRWFRLLIRDRAEYRMLDQVFTLRLMSLLFPLVYRWKKKSIPKELRDQAMGIESLFK